MIDVPNEDQDSLPQETREVLRDIYAPPSGPGYWEALEARILARVRREGTRAWWTYFPDWMRAGVVAAAAALVLFALVWFQDRQAAQRMAEQQLLQPLIDEVPVLVETMADEPERARNATLRYVISR